jgi:signal transduction histidine kinase
VFVALHPHVKYYLTLLFLLFWASYISAQNTEISVLKKQLTAARTDTGRVNLFFQLGKHYEGKNLDSGLYFLQKSLAIANKTSNFRASARAMAHIGYTYVYYASDDDKALVWINKAVKLAKSQNDYLSLAHCYQLLGIISIHQHIENTEELNNLALEYAVKSNDWKMISDSYEIIAANFAAKHNFKKAEEAILKAMVVSKKHDIDTWLSQGLDLCILLEEQGKDKESFLLAKKLSLFKDKLKKNKRRVVYMNDLGRLETKLKNYKKAESIFLSILDEEKQKTKVDTFNLYHIFSNLETLYLVQKDYKKAYEAGENVHSTRLWLAQKRQSKDSQLQMTQLKASSDLGKKEAEISLLAEQKKKQLLFLVAAIMIAVLMIGFVIMLQRNKRKIEQQKAELSKLNVTKDRLFSIIAHDLRGPITSFKGILHLFGNNSLSQKEFVDLSKSLNQNVDNIHAMLENLLLWSLSQMNGLKPFLRELYVIDVVEEAIALVKEIANRKDIELQINVPENLHFFADENNLRAIVRNLLNNALKFTPQHGRVTVSGHQQGKFTELKIIDTGIGIKPEDLETIFSDPKLKQGTAGEKGTGLGLVLCKELIEQNGGKISVTSQYGQGTIFTIVLRNSEATSILV